MIFILADALHFIESNARAGNPFFAYIPTAIPHAAMHAPPDLHAKWREVFPEFDHLVGEYGAGKLDECPPVQNPIAGFAAIEPGSTSEHISAFWDFLPTAAELTGQPIPSQSDGISYQMKQIMREAHTPLKLKK